MNLTLTNNGADALPIFAPKGGWVDALEPGVPLGVNDDQMVLIIGDKPDVREQLEQAANVLSEVARRAIEAYQNRTKPDTSTAPLAIVRVQIENLGANAVRVLLGNGTDDFAVAPGDTETCVAAGYLELRELGRVQQDPNQREAA